jgi:gliding motility-associated-like protein
LTNSFLPTEAHALPGLVNNKSYHTWLSMPFALVVLILSSFTTTAQAPVAAFTSTVTQGCAPVVVVFQDQSTGDPKFWNWDLGNGQLSNLQNPTAVYATPGTYTVTLVVRNASGTNGITKTNYITVYPSPTANFIADKVVACVPADIQFQDMSSDTSGGAVNKWLWDFGDGTTSTVKNPVKSYGTTGFYTVTLTATSSTGCSSSISRFRYIRVVSGVTADFIANADSVCRAPFGVTFKNETSGPGVMNYAWDFGNTSTSTVANPSTSYAATGTFNVQLIATSEYGCSDTLVKPVSITGANTNFNAPDSACLNKPVNFTNASAPAAISAFWNFGDGTTSTQLNPSKTFTAPGIYNVTLYNTYARCTDSITKQITVIPTPAVDFTVDKQYTCKGPFTVNFQDASPNAVAWLWNFGDGNTSTLQNPSHTYTADGQYNVTLRITTSFGCEATTTKPAHIRIEKPVVNIANIPNGGCIPFTFSPAPNVTTIDPVVSYFWDFGHNGATSTSPGPSYTYTDSGTFTIKLRITTAGGCIDSIVGFNSIRTGPVPFVDFSVDTTTACAFGPVAFFDLSNPADRWLWEFGDGTTSTVKNPTHAYADTGTYSVKLSAYNNGCPGTITKNQLITVRPPVADFTDSVNCANKLNVIFTNESITNGVYGPVSYSWNFGDAANTTSTLANPTFTYPALGSYFVSLTVTNGTCSHTIVREVKLVAELADFVADDVTPCKNQVVTFNAINSNAANVAQYDWFVDGTLVASGPSRRMFQMTFPLNGTYTVQLVITDNNGCVNTRTVMNYITVAGPTANFNAVDTGGCRNSSITFSDLSAPAGNISQWKWEFGDNTTQTFTAPPFTHVYADTGWFNVKLTVTDNQGCTDFITKNNLIRITKPMALFKAASTKFCPGAELQFTDSSRGYITGYQWSFGDGGTSTDQNPIHIYTGGDSMYTVRLVVTDTTGCTDTLTKVNYIDVRRPKPAFTATDTSAICPPLETKFFIGGTDYETYYWDFGDGQTSNQQNPRHFFNTYGTYESKLYVSGYGGCIDSAVKIINVFNPYNTPFSYSPLDSCNSLLVNFTVAPPANTTFYLYFGDGTVDSSQNTTFSHFYSSPSFYSPYMLLKDKQDCQIPVGGPDVIRIYGAEPFFAVDRKSFCDSGTVYFTNYTIANDTIVSSVWDFGDGITSTAKDAIHTFTTPGTYHVSLEVTTQRGCVKRLYDTILVHRTPSPSINSADVVCINSPLLLQGNLAVPDTAITWSWSFGNGQTSTQQNTQVTYNSTGVKTITLSAKNKIGCEANTTADITVVPLPNINIFADPTIVLGNGIAIPVTYSRNVVTYNWTPATSLSCTDCPNPYANPKFNTRYTVAVTDSNGCAASRDITVTVICNNSNFFIPNTFSPNNDGQNDVFYVRGRGIERIQSIRIFNRWGQPVFEKRDFMANDKSSGWDGTLKGKPADQDVYVYVIEVICENATIIPFRGNVALIR